MIKNERVLQMNEEKKKKKKKKLKKKKKRKMDQYIGKQKTQNTRQELH